LGRSPPANKNGGLQGGIKLATNTFASFIFYFIDIPQITHYAMVINTALLRAIHRRCTIYGHFG
jgi:hypothetical protein